MSCALTSDADYPDYLKSILKQIAIGNDDDLKTCACQLKTPLNQNGCPILDEDGKLGAFPFCITEAPESELIPCENLEGDAPFLSMFNEISLKNLMRLYWRTKKINVSFKTDLITNNTQSLTRSTTDQKGLVCKDFNFNSFDNFNFGTSNTNNINPYNNEQIGVSINFNSDSIYKIDNILYIKAPSIYYLRYPYDCTPESCVDSYKLLFQYKPSYFTNCYPIGNTSEVQLAFGDIFNFSCTTVVGGDPPYVAVNAQDITITPNFF